MSRGWSFLTGLPLPLCQVASGKTLGKLVRGGPASLLELRGTPVKLCVPSPWRKPTGTPGRKAKGMVTTAKIGTIRIQAPNGAMVPMGKVQRPGGRAAVSQQGTAQGMVRFAPRGE